jgi:hypothetical protein
LAAQAAPTTSRLAHGHSTAANAAIVSIHKARSGHVEGSRMSQVRSQVTGQVTSQIKRTIGLPVAAATLAALVVLQDVRPGAAAGSIAYSLSQQLDRNGKLLAGCKLYIIQAGTTSTPQNAYQDTGLTLPHPNPILCDASGRLPAFYLADGQIKIRLTDRNEVTQVVADNILVIGPSSGGGGGGGVDPTTVMQTGDFKAAYGNAPISGFVRCNGRTIGGAVSGATERANSDTSALFSFLWNADPNLTVSGGGRGGSAASDYAANKTITLPDCRGRTLAGLDDMGNSAAGRLTVTYFGAAGTTLGAAGGSQNFTLTTPNLPPYTPAGSVTSTSGTSVILNNGTNGAGPGSPFYGSGGTISISSSFTGAPQGGTSTPLATVQPTLLTSIYIKL